MKSISILISFLLIVTNTLIASESASVEGFEFTDTPYVIDTVHKSELLCPKRKINSVVIIGDYNGIRASGTAPWDHIIIDFETFYKHPHALDSDFAGTIAENIKASSGVKKLTLKGNISLVDANLVSAYLIGVKGLEVLEIDGCTSPHSHQMLLSLVKSLPELKEVSFINGFSNLGMMCIQDYIKDWVKIKKLTLDGDMSGEDVYSFLRRLPEFTSLKGFSISCKNTEVVNMSTYLHENAHLIRHLKHFRFTEGEIEIEDNTGDFF